MSDVERVARFAVVVSTHDCGVARRRSVEAIVMDCEA